MSSYIKKILAISIVVLTGCENNFDGDLSTNPNQLSINGFYSSPAGVNAAVIGIYANLTTPRNLGSSGRGMYMHHRTDEMSSGANQAATGKLDERLSPSLFIIQQPWALMYTAAFSASDVIENADKADFNGDVNLRNAYVGEAHALRAFIHFFLLINFRSIPILDKIPTDRSEFIRPQADPMEVWNFIIDDLNTAKTLLPSRDFWGNEYAGRFTAGGAAGLLGKVYLTMSGITDVDKYNDAAKEFADVINGVYGEYSLMDNYIHNFDVEHENNSESILEFQFLGDGDENTGFNPGFSDSGLFSEPRGFAPPGLVGGDAVVHDWLWEEFVGSIDNDGATDRRMFGTLVFDDLNPSIVIPDLNNDGNFTNDRLALNDGMTFEQVYVEDGTFGGKVPQAAPYKAANRKWLDWNLKLDGLNSGADDRFREPRAHGLNWRFIRYSDVLLMYAESVLMGGMASAITALDAVNMVRSRANVPLLGNLTMEELKRERILELSCEGHRALDLLRWGELGSRMAYLEANDPNFKQFGGGTYLGFQPGKNDYLPIPIDEISSNPLAVQNPGW